MISCMFIIIIILFSSISLGVGVQGPAELKLMFKPGYEFQVNYAVVNNMGYIVPVKLSVAESAVWGTAKLDKAEVISKPGSKMPFTLDVKLADKMPEKPGPHYIYVGALEDPPKSRSGTVAARTGVYMKIRLMVPYPDKYVEANLDIPGVAQGVCSHQE